MLDLFDRQIRNYMAPLIEQVATLETDIEDLRRRARNQQRIGICSEVDPAALRCRVSHGENLTPWIKYFNPSAGEVSETRHPSVGEQCLLMNFSGGDSGAQYLALFGLPCDAFPPVSTEAQVHRKTYPDGTTTAYDYAAHRLDWLIGATSIKADREGIELMFGAVGIKIDASGVHHLGPLVDHNGIDIGLTHTHKDTQPQAGAFSGPVA